MTEKNPPILENILTPAPSVLLGQKNNWLLLAGINWSAIVKSFTRQNWCVKYQCSPKWVPSEMFCFKKELLVLFLSPGQGCDSSSCEWDVICTSFAIVSHSCLVKSCQPAEHAASARLCQASLEMQGMGVSSGSPCALSWNGSRTASGPSSADTTKKHNFCQSSVLGHTPPHSCVPTAIVTCLKMHRGNSKAPSVLMSCHFHTNSSKSTSFSHTHKHFLLF